MGSRLETEKGSGGGFVAGMVSINNSLKTQSTDSFPSTNKRSTIGTGDRIAILDEDGNQKMTESGEPAVCELTVTGNSIRRKGC